MSYRNPILLSAAALAVAACAASAELLVGLTSQHRLVQFDTLNPTVLLTNVAVTGLLAGDSETLAAIDYRPADGNLYAVSSADRLYTVSPVTGVATPVFASQFAIPFFGVSAGQADLDINPVADRIRFSQGNFNARLNPTASGATTGGAVDGNVGLAGIQPDGSFAYVAGDPNVGRNATGVAVHGLAYTNNDTNPATPTRSYVIENAPGGLSVLAEVTNFNGGALTTVATLTLAQSLSLTSLDVSALSGTAFLSDATLGINRLFTVDLSTGATVLLSDAIPNTAGSIRSITAAVPEPAALSLLAPAGALLARRRRA